MNELELAKAHFFRAWTWVGYIVLAAIILSVPISCIRTQYEDAARGRATFDEIKQQIDAIPTY